MVILKIVYDKLQERLDILREDLKEARIRMNEYKAEGDLSENNDFIQERQNVENLQADMMKINSLLERAEILQREPTTDFTTIDLGCKFFMSVTVNGNYFNEKKSSKKKIGEKNNESLIIYNEDENCTSIEGNYYFGGPTDICEELNILSNESPVGKLLMGRSLSNGYIDIVDEELGTKIHVERIR